MGSDGKPLKVALTLENCILPDDRLQQTPSQKDGLSTDDEMDIRLISCEMIQHAGVLLRLPQVAMATAQVVFQRFFYRKSLVKHSYEHIAMACLFMAAKIEEAPRRIRDVINVFHHIKQFKTGRSFEPMSYTGNSYWIAKNGIITAERRVLKELGFCCHVKHPHKLITTFLQILDHGRHEKLVQLAWNYMNDSLRSNVFVRFPVETIACACIHLAALKLKVALPSNPPWYWVFDTSLEDIQMISFTILMLYERKQRSLGDLDDAIAKAKKSVSANSSASNVNSPAMTLLAPSPAPPESVASSTNSPALARASSSAHKHSSSLATNRTDSPMPNGNGSGTAHSSTLPSSPKKSPGKRHEKAESPAKGRRSGDDNSSASGSGSGSDSDSGHSSTGHSSSSTGSSSRDSSPATRRGRSPDARRHSQSPDRYNSRSPPRKHYSRSPERRRSRSPHGNRRRHGKSPGRRRSPHRHRSRTPERRRSRSPYRRLASPRRRDREGGRWRERDDRGHSRFSSHSSRHDRHRDR